MSRSALEVRKALPTRVYRFYRGGGLIDHLRGEIPTDGHFPEDWAASMTRANNPGQDRPDEGLTRLADGELLRDAIAANPVGWLGAAHVERFGPSTGLLVKLLDTAERLPVHFHPDRRFANAHLDSPFGKTEAWYVLATRESSGEVWVGMRDSVDPEAYRTWIEQQASGELLASLNRVEVRAGDLVYVPAGVPHAIGCGLLVAELQEPTDFSVVCEWDGFPIEPADAHLGLGWDVAAQALDLRPHVPIRALPDEADAFFSIEDELVSDGRFSIVLVLDGQGSINGAPAAAGDVFAVPAALEDVDVKGEVKLLRCIGPDPAAG